MQNATTWDIAISATPAGGYAGAIGPVTDDVKAGRRESGDATGGALDARMFSSFPADRSRLPCVHPNTHSQLHVQP